MHKLSIGGNLFPLRYRHCYAGKSRPTTHVVGRSARGFSALASFRHPVTFAKPSISDGGREAYRSISKCPAPSCECSPTPALPEAVDYKANIRNSAPGYVEHVVICTGRSDWSSRIEDEGKHENEKHLPSPPSVKDRFKSAMKTMLGRSGAANIPVSEDYREVGLARGLKALLGPKGPYFDPQRPILVTNSSFPSELRSAGVTSQAAAYLFPSFRYVSGIEDMPAGYEAFVRSFLIPTDHIAHNGPEALNRSSLISVPTILICSHGTRDSRCGILGPLLYAEFCRQLGHAGIAANATVLASDTAGAASRSLSSPWPAANVGMVSHIGGHKWAGNVIVYLPPDLTGSPLSGRSIWYGRVEPRHVEGIVQETVIGGGVIEELCRGVRL